MSIGKWKFTLPLLFLSVYLIVYNAASSLAATSSKVTQINNPFSSLLPEKNNSVSLPQFLSKSVSTKKQLTVAAGQGKSLEQLLSAEWQLSELLRWLTNVIQQNGLQLEEQNFG